MQFVSGVAEDAVQVSPSSEASLECDSAGMQLHVQFPYTPYKAPQTQQILYIIRHYRRDQERIMMWEAERVQACNDHAQKIKFCKCSHGSSVTILGAHVAWVHQRRKFESRCLLSQTATAVKITGEVSENICVAVRDSLAV